MKPESNNEQLILEAAETEFIEKGYKNAATTAIAKKAGVTHAMLHYYFRTKENLFQKVFQNKVRLVGEALYQNVNENLPFEETIRKFIEFHFEFLRQNPKILNFVFNEVIVNKNNRTFVLEHLQPKVLKIINRVDELLTAEISKGKIRPVKTQDLLFNILSMNVVTFMALPLIEDLAPVKNAGYIDNFINERKESNVQFVLNSLKI